MDFTGKVCVITGAANGIGRKIATDFLERGAFVAFIDISKTHSDSLCAAYPEQTYFMYGDISDEDTLREFAIEVVSRYKRVDYLINNACGNRRGLLSGCSMAEFEYVFKMGVAAPYYLSKLFMNYFATGACIINISSTRQIMSQPDTESYSAAKGGIGALTHALAASLSGWVRVNAISPGWIETQPVSEHSVPDLRQHPAGRVGRPEDVSNAVLFLCSDQASFITGQNLIVDGGMSRLMIYNGDGGWTYEP